MVLANAHSPCQCPHFVPVPWTEGHAGTGSAGFGVAVKAGVWQGITPEKPACTGSSTTHRSCTFLPPSRCPQGLGAAPRLLGEFGLLRCAVLV